MPQAPPRPVTPPPVPPQAAPRPPAAPPRPSALPPQPPAATTAPPARPPAPPVNSPSPGPSSRSHAVAAGALPYAAPPVPPRTTSRPAAVPLPPAAPVPPAPAPPHGGEPHGAPGPRGPRTSTVRRRLGSAVCLVLGLGLIGGATAGAVINHGPRGDQPVADGSVEAFAKARNVWRNTPVDQLFPLTYTEKNGGPGGADRSWTRIGVAAPAGCADAFDPLLRQVLAPVGCARLLRATYVDSTSTTVTTVGLLVASAEAPAMSALGSRWDTEHLGERSDLMPRPVAFPGTPAASFGDGQRGSWDVQVSTDLPFVVYAVSGFADGRVVTTPQPADKADADGATTASAQAGLGFDATDLASVVDDRVHAAATAELHPTPTESTE